METSLTSPVWRIMSTSGLCGHILGCNGYTCLSLMTGGDVFDSEQRERDPEVLWKGLYYGVNITTNTNILGQIFRLCLLV